MSLFVTKNTATETWLGSRVTGDTEYRFLVQADGKIRWGPGGTSTTDIELTRTYNGDINRAELNVYNAYSIFGNLNLRRAMIKSYNAPLVTGLTLADCAQDEGSILFSDVTTGNWLNLYLVNVGPSQPGNPILACNQGIWVKKDINTSGAFMTNSPTNGTGGGAVLIGKGFYGNSSFPPCIVLTEQQTLYLYTNVVSQTLGNMQLGTLTANSIDCNGAIHGGGGNGDAFKVGDDIYIVDVNQANALCLQGAYDRASAKIYFGSGQDTNLYRSAANQLKTDDVFIIAGNFYGISLSLNGGINIGADTNLYRSAADLLRTNDTFQAAGYKSSDGTNGATADVAISGTTLHFKNGLFVGIN